MAAITRRLPVALSEEEVAEKAEELAEADVEWRKANDQKKAAAAKWNEKLADLDTARRELAKVVYSGEELRPVECEWINNHVAGKRELRRVDTNEVVESKDLTAKDMQTAMFN